MASSPFWSSAPAAVKIRNSPWLYFFSRLLVGGVFLYASFDKILHPQEFSTAIQNYRLLPSAYALPLTLILPWIEALAGLFLILGLFSRACAYIILILLLVFIGALFSALVRGLDISCGCFDLKDKSSHALGLLNSIFRDVVLTFFACQIITSLSSKFSLSDFLPSPIKKLVD